jgi:TonB family protein
MTYQAAQQFDRITFRQVPAPALMALSVLFHCVFLVILPLVSMLLYNVRRFERPKTFQLVSPLRPSPARQVVTKETRRQRMAQEEAKPQPSTVPDRSAARKTREAQKEKEAARPIDENLDELASLLDEIPSPAQVAAVGNFKYHWYLNNVQQKLERFWNPTSENRTLKVVVAFTIHGDGSISDPSIKSSSGNSTLDNLALRAVKLAAPFGKLPPGFSGDRLDLNCTLIPTRK